MARELGKPLQPERVCFVTALPKTRNGKTVRRVIRAAYLGEKPGDISALENPAVLDEIRGLNAESKGGLMPVYHQLGEIPSKRHKVYRKSSGELYAEELMGNMGFTGPSSLIYHVRRPTAIRALHTIRELTWNMRSGGTTAAPAFSDAAIEHRR